MCPGLLYLGIISKGDIEEDGMQEEAEFEELRVHVLGLREEGYVLRVHKLPFVDAATAGLLFSARGGEDIRPQLQGIRQGVGTVTP
jgi:hypothetical protein